MLILLQAAKEASIRTGEKSLYMQLAGLGGANTTQS